MGENKKKKEETVAASLPQNVMLIGERVDGEKNIYISQSVYREIQKFTKDKLKNESGGVLIGEVVEAIGKTNILIEGFIEAKHSEGTPTTLKFTHETWEYIHKEMDKKYEGKKMVGWIHTHPSFGIFLSEYDIFIHQNYFNEDYEIAYVVDPIQHTEGFFYWLNEKIERCPGFYVYDKVGKKINVTQEEESVQGDSGNSNNWQKYAIIALVVIVVALGVFIMALQNEVKNLKYDINEKVKKLNTNEIILEQQYESLTADVQSMKAELEQSKLDISGHSGELDEISGGISQELSNIQYRIDAIEAGLHELQEQNRLDEEKASESELFEETESIFN